MVIAARTLLPFGEPGQAAVFDDAQVVTGRAEPDRLRDGDVIEDGGATELEGLLRALQLRHGGLVRGSDECLYSAVDGFELLVLLVSGEHFRTD
jgi:hypothetical protein